MAGVQQHRRNVIRGTSGSFQVSFAFAWFAQSFGTTSCSVVQEVTVVTDRLTQNQEFAEQARQLLEAHRTAGQMLEERVSWTDAFVRNTFLAGGTSTARAEEAPGADDGRFVLERFRRDTNQRILVAKTLDGAIGPGYFVLVQDGFNQDECKKSSNQWRHDLEMRSL